jgi:hypothetical protein
VAAARGLIEAALENIRRSIAPIVSAALRTLRPGFALNCAAEGFVGQTANIRPAANRA